MTHTTRQGAIASLTGDVSRLEKQKQDFELRADTVLGHTVDSQRRLQAGRQLTDLFSRHGLQALEEGPAVKGDERKLPQSLAAAIERLGKDRGRKTRETAQVRRLQLVGRYIDLMEAVQELAQATNPPGVPIRLTMAEADADAEARSWTLWVWMRTEGTKDEGGRMKDESRKLTADR